MNFSLISLVLFIKTTIAKLLRNVIFFLFFLSSPSSGPNESEVDEKRISRPVFLDRSRNSSTRFSCENRETIVKVLGLSARLTSARLVIYCVGARAFRRSFFPVSFFS